MRKLILRPVAAADIDQIFDYTAERWNFLQAVNYTNAILETCHNLADGHLNGRDAGDIRPGFRRQTCRSHVIFYRLLPNNLEVVRILHQRMDFDSRLANEP